VVADDRVGSKGADLLGKLLRDPSESDRAPKETSGGSHLAPTDSEAVPDLLLGQEARHVLDPGEHVDLATQTPQDAGLKHRPHDGPRLEQIRMEDDAYPHGPVTHRRALTLPGLRAARHGGFHVVAVSRADGGLVDCFHLRPEAIPSEVRRVL